jgi:UDP-N-acetylglucosamine--dolichyl-phosphate N-acetylglucosaminephosphotransferase
MLGTIVLLVLSFAIVISVGYIVADRTTLLFAKIMRKRGIIGLDVHKLNKPEIPEMCGLSIITALIIGTILLILLFPTFIRQLLAFILTVLIATLIGSIDVIRPFKATIKPLITAFACLPIFVFQTFDPYPPVPFIVHVRMPVLYFLLIPFLVTLAANAVNMIDIFNGSMAGTSMITSTSLLFCSLILGKYQIAVIYCMLTFCLLGFYKHNKYPSKVFSGDAGSLGVGAALGAIAVIGDLEALTLIATLPLLFNMLFSILSIGRLYERREIKERPTILLDDGSLIANKSEKAPLTLTRLIVASNSMLENDIVKCFYLLSTFSGALAVLTAFLMVI